MADTDGKVPNPDASAEKFKALITVLSNLASRTNDEVVTKYYKGLSALWYEYTHPQPTQTSDSSGPKGPRQ